MRLRGLDAPYALDVTVDMGNFLNRSEAAALAAQANQLIRSGNHAQALANLRRAIQLDPENAGTQNNLAWYLLAGPESLRDPKEALPLARRAVELASDASRPLYLNTLGVALYRNGRYAEALATLEESLAAGKGASDGFDLFFLAMCHAQLGDAAKAKDCFDRAVKWVEQKQDLPTEHIAELSQFRTETAEVLDKK